MSIIKKRILREYVFTNKELKERFNLKGDIESIEFFEGFKDKPSKSKWEIKTVEIHKK